MIIRIRFILATLILLLACALQFWSASAGVFVNFILATLIAFAFFFDIWELVVFVLFAIFVVNWQPVIGLDIITFGIIPVAAYAFHRAFSWAAWAALPAAVIVGFALLYLAAAPGAFLGSGRLFLTDLFGGLVFAIVVFLVLERVTPQSR